MPNRSSGEKTKLILADSLRTLLKKKPLDKIKIRDIVDECGLNRQTFYYHFQDIYNLIEWMYRFDGINIISKYIEQYDFMSIRREMAEYIEDHRDELLNIYHSKAYPYFLEFLFNSVGKYFTMLINKRSEGIDFPEEFKTFLSKYYTSAIIGVVSDWVRSPSSLRMSTDELTTLFYVTTQNSMKLAFENYHKTNEN